MQSREATALRHRQKAEDQQLHNAAARRDFDRVAEVQARREPARGIERERQHGRGPHLTGRKPGSQSALSGEGFFDVAPPGFILRSGELIEDQSNYTHGLRLCSGGT
jgi:hypothetical protein